MRYASLHRIWFHATLLTLLLPLLLAGLASPLPAQSPMAPFSGTAIGSYQDPVQKAAEAYSRGMKAKRKADGETDPKGRKKLLERAKNEFGRSIGYSANYDAFLALGQVQLALGETAAALDSCNRALALKPADTAAQGCLTAAKTAMTGTPAAGTPAEPAKSGPPR